MRNLSILKVQPKTLRNVEPKTIVERAYGRFDVLAVTSPDSQRDRFIDLADTAHSHNLSIAWWDAVAYWNIADLPLECNIRAVWPDAPRDWANLDMRLTRDLITERTARIQEDMSEHIDLYFVDYLRYGYNWEVRSGHLLTTNGVTATMQQLSGVSRVPIIANVFEWPKALGIYSQDWENWVEQELVNGVNVRYYNKPNDLSIVIPLGVTIDKMNVCMAVGGVRDFNALTEAEVVRYLEVAAQVGFNRVSVFDWPNCERLGFWSLFDREPTLEDRIAILEQTMLNIANGFKYLSDIINEAHLQSLYDSQRELLYQTPPEQL